ncbi:guanylate cyclase [Ottowia testudinis]|uniref:Guanylate cyclase n=1 Tax=Ottowia testudinis TaxID=2816950 RepID=A0A975CIX1_9BURK|nr:guanylate cyclase [Ottowia testudinis]QTD46602.1 guanylate cyclase [Ottowia testudinis]
MENALLALRAHLDQGGLPAGLKFLNDRVSHRFTGVYRLQGGTMHNAGLIDKRGEIAPDALLAVPLTSSFCQFVLRDGVFATGLSGSDDRLAGHPYQGVLNSYVGLPLTRTGDDLQGTLCHFDFEPVQVPEPEFDFLRKAALLLPRYLPRG